MKRRCRKSDASNINDALWWTVDNEGAPNVKSRRARGQHSQCRVIAVVDTGYDADSAVFPYLGG